MKNFVLIQNLNVAIFTKDDKEPQNDALIRNFLDELIDVLNMTVLIPTIGVRVPILNYQDYKGNKIRPDDMGLTHLTGIAESHIATHTWPEYKLIYLEISSCKEFQSEKVIDAIKRYFTIERIEPKEDKRTIPVNRE